MSKSSTTPEAEAPRLAVGLVATDRVSVRLDEFHVLHVTVDGEEHHEVRAVRAFPLTDKAGYVSFLGDKDKEVALLADPQNLDEASRGALDHVLKLNYFVPKITRVFSIGETWGVSHWKVETDRGYASFEVIDRDKTRRLSTGSIIIIDADENRYVIEDPDALDPRSYNLIQSET